MFLYTFYRRYLWLLRVIALFFMGLVVAVIIALNQINLETLRGNIISALRDATNLPVEIDGKISWKFSLRPEIKLSKVRIQHADWAEDKNLFYAKNIFVRIDLFSLFKKSPAIRNIKIYDATVSLEQDENGEDSIVFNKPFSTDKKTDTDTKEPSKYPVNRLPFGGLEIQNLTANIYNDVYTINGFGIHNYMRHGNIEFSGWIKPGESNIPFIINFSEYNAERKIYPMRIAFATGGDALIANVALEGTSKMPIDFIVRGDIPHIKKSGGWLNIDTLRAPTLKVNLIGGFDRKKVSFRKSTISAGKSFVSFSGVYDWSSEVPVIDAKITSDYIDIYKTFPEWFNVGKEWIHPKRDLNVFLDMPLLGDFFYNTNTSIDLNLKKFVIYHSLDLADLGVVLKIKNNKVRADVKTGIASGDIDAVVVGNLNEEGVYDLEAAAHGEHIYVGEILKEIDVENIISGLPLNLSLYVKAHGKDMSQIMQTMTGPLIVYSVDRGFAHADLVEYMYGGDFLTALRHNVQDLFTGKKRDMIEISRVIANVKIRDGLIETQNGVAVETPVINMRLAGTLDLGKEKIQLSLATVPVRGLKLSLSGNLVNAMQITGNLAEPDFKISGAAIAGKVGSAVGLGLLFSPITGGLSIAGGLVAGLLAGDLLESWLADDHPYNTAMKNGAPHKSGDPEWLNQPVEILIAPLLN